MIAQETIDRMKAVRQLREWDFRIGSWRKRPVLMMKGGVARDFRFAIARFNDWDAELR